jgi:hypothetical protein
VRARLLDAVDRGELSLAEYISITRVPRSYREVELTRGLH